MVDELVVWYLVLDSGLGCFVVGFGVEFCLVGVVYDCFSGFVLFCWWVWVFGVWCLVEYVVMVGLLFWFVVLVCCLVWWFVVLLRFY